MKMADEKKSVNLDHWKDDDLKVLYLKIDEVRSMLDKLFNRLDDFSGKADGDVLDLLRDGLQEATGILFELLKGIGYLHHVLIKIGDEND
jgi:hypothetical protein